MDDVVVYSHGPRWVSLSTNAVTVAPHAATTVNLAFDATGLAVGAHDAELVVRSNDPDESVLVVPIDLQVADVAATIDVDPNTLNLDRRANWVTAYLELPAPGDLGGVVVSTLRLNRASSADPTQHSIGDEDHDGVADMTLKFDQDALAPTLEEGDQVAVVMTGELPGNHRLLGTSTIRVIRHHVTAPNGGEVVAPGGTLAVRWSVPSGWHPDHADVLVSFNGGTSWSRIAADLTGTTFSWVVPNVATQAALVRVTLFDALGEIGHDSSDQPFTITANPTAIQGPGEGGPHRLLQNSPNPFRSATETSIGFVLPGPGSVRLAVYDAKGYLTGVIADGWMPAGAHQVIWDGRDRLGRPVSAGVYFYQLRAGEVRLTQRMVVLR
ncbi:MAG: hypothetical protein E6K81_14860 [Candidatus Eisenbacteria bacterium]|uniref:FlgD/Vpr Ig-like domain-containing protein n=1 Tax=Eiseniibacteriota bacterium TaxID=2212470 RepID=A0A538U0Q4_UNCEI|nr:MAG: hypothetical protein E6K81_14860 [Candidatus Eisenbacteria bacterium]